MWCICCPRSERSGNPKAGASPLGESRWQDVKLLVNGLWQKIAAKLSKHRHPNGNDAPTSDSERKTATRTEKTATNTIQKPTETPQEKDHSAPCIAVDIAIRKPIDNKLLHRRTLLNPKSSQNFIGHDVLQDIGIEMCSYPSRFAVTLGEEEVVPLGYAKVEWHFSPDFEKTYTTSFLVIETQEFDTLLGGPFIKEHQLHKTLASG